MLILWGRSRNGPRIVCVACDKALLPEATHKRASLDFENLAQTSIHNLRAKRVSQSLRNCGIEKGERRKPLRAHLNTICNRVVRTAGGTSNFLTL